ncbi:MAG TPA: HEPN domain-containing protein [Burkholderiaceae bacterium]
MTPVDRLYQEAQDVIAALGTSEPSLVVSASDNFRKALLMAAASYFEHRITSCVAEFVQEKAAGSTLVVAFVKNKAIARQYHTYFKWDAANANQFFGLFGAEFGAMMQARVRESDELRDAVRAFLEVGNERNKLVHQDYATFALEKNLDEVYASFQVALRFVNSLANHLRDCPAAAA